VTREWRAAFVESFRAAGSSGPDKRLDR